MTSIIKSLIEKHTVALSGSRNGQICYVKIGSVVVVSGFVQLTGSLSNGTILATGLPLPYSQLAGLPEMNSSTGATGNAFVNTNHDLCVGGTWATGYHRINGAYVAS